MITYLLNFIAAENDYVECVRLLLENGADVNCRNAGYQTPLHLACLSQSVETVEMLIKYGANVNAHYRDGRTALHAAIVKQSRCLDCCIALLKAGADVNKADNYGYTPLHIAALNEFSNCVYTFIGKICIKVCFFCGIEQGVCGMPTIVILFVWDIAAVVSRWQKNSKIVSENW